MSIFIQICEDVIVGISTCCKEIPYRSATEVLKNDWA